MPIATNMHITKVHSNIKGDAFFPAFDENEWKQIEVAIIETIEKTNRSFYGGAIGFMDFKGNFNHAIMIRSFLSKNHNLHFQAGAGIVASSSEENETQEVYNKLGALQKALDLAEII